ncbi:MAG: hypothetical protein ABI380_08585 [Edaphobacter sp.]
MAAQTTIHEAEDWLQSVFSALGASYVERFSGLGLILYYPRLPLPVLPLVQSASALPLPTRNLQESIQLLHVLCQFDSAFHDGFHLVDAESLSITHVSQFFSPPIPDIVPELRTDHPIGARFMSAWLGSNLPAVCMTATLSKSEGGLVFSRGVVRTLFAPGK